MKNILLVSQSAVGRSDPQIIYLANSLADEGLKVHIAQCIHPNSPKPDIRFINPNVVVHSFYPTIQMWSRAGFSEFALHCKQLFIKNKCDSIFSFDYSGILTTLLISEIDQIQFTSCIFMLENIDYMINSHGLDSLDYLSKVWEISYIIYPEINRMNVDISSFSSKLSPPKSIYIISPTSPSALVDEENINSKVKHPKKLNSFIYAGSIVKESFAIEFGYSLQSSNIDYKYDLYGPIGPNWIKQLEDMIEYSSGKAEYHGVLDQTHLNKIYPNYSYSFTGWKPLSTNYYYACPNKFFQSLKHGVIPITVEHPLIRNVIDNFEISIVNLSWTELNWPNELRTNLDEDISIYNEKILKNYNIFSSNLSWQSQFNKFLKHIQGYN